MLDIFQVYDMALLEYQGEGNEGGEGVGGLLSTLVDDKRPLNNRYLGRIVHPYDAFVTFFGKTYTNDISLSLEN